MTGPTRSDIDPGYASFDPTVRPEPAPDPNASQPRSPRAAPKTPAEAKDQLDAMKADKGWRDDFLRGNVSARTEFDAAHRALAEADRVDQAVEGRLVEPGFETLTEGQLPARDLNGAVADLRAGGLDDQSIRQILSGDATLTAEQIALAKELKLQKFSDADWRARLLAGDAVAKRELTVISAALVAGESLSH